tara:strand:+ start:1808 stop:2998 length:1191 start_codon:yes stop_codon:yes gene_type:complete
MFDKYLQPDEQLVQKEGGYGGELKIKFSGLITEIMECTMPMPDVASLRKSYTVRNDKSLSQEEMEDELVLNQRINFHFASLKANYRNLESCHWMRGEQVPNCWSRLGHELPVNLSNEFDDAVYFDINVIESQLYPEGVGVVVATVPNNGTRKPIQRPASVRRIKADVLLSDALSIPRRVITQKDMIDKGFLTEPASGAIYDVRIVIDSKALEHEDAPTYGFNVETPDNRTLHCTWATKEAHYIMELLGINFMRPPRPKHIQPFEYTTCDVGYFKLPLRYSGWKRFIDELNSSYNALCDLDDGFGTSPDNDLPAEVGAGGKPQRLQSDEDIVRALRAQDEKRPLSRSDIRRRRDHAREKLAKQQGEDVQLVEMNDPVDDVFNLSNDQVLNIDDLPNL